MDTNFCNSVEPETLTLDRIHSRFLRAKLKQDRGNIVRIKIELRKDNTIECLFGISIDIGGIYQSKLIW